MLGGAGLDRGLLAVQALGVLEVLGLEALGDLLHGGALFLPFLDELVVNVGDVGNVDHLVAAVLQITAQGIEHDQRAGVADVDVVVNRRAADVDAVLARHLRHKFFLLTGQGVENLHGISAFLWGSGSGRAVVSPAFSSGASHPCPAHRGRCAPQWCSRSAAGPPHTVHRGTWHAGRHGSASTGACPRRRHSHSPP